MKKYLHLSFRQLLYIGICLVFALTGFKSSADNSQNFFIDESLHEKAPLNQLANDFTNAFHVFSHGEPGKLLIDGKWMNKYSIADYFKTSVQGHEAIFIYGCEFAKGREGKSALAYLQSELQIPVLGSNDITGVDGDWELEVGNYSFDFLTVPI